MATYRDMSFSELVRKYDEAFGERYGAYYINVESGMDIDDAIEDIIGCLKSGKPSEYAV